MTETSLQNAPAMAKGDTPGALKRLMGMREMGLLCIILLLCRMRCSALRRVDQWVWEWRGSTKMCACE